MQNRTKLVYLKIYTTINANSLSVKTYLFTAAFRDKK